MSEIGRIGKGQDMAKVQKTQHRAPIVLGDLQPQDKLAQAIKKQGWPIGELATELGVDRTTVTHLTKGKHRPRRNLCDALCETLNMEWADLFTYERPLYRGER